MRDTTLQTIRNPIARGLCRVAVIALATVLSVSPARAAFHLWNIREIYSNADGSLQYIEFFTSDFSQQFVGGQSVQAINIGATLTHTFVVPSNLPSDSFNHAFLIATAGVQAAGGPAPDYIMPNGFLFTAGGSISFFGANSGAYTALPTDGDLARIWAGGNAVNSPQNFAGSVGHIVVPEPGMCAMLAMGAGAALFFRRRSK